jgi:alkyldihydroxyacetonephosphate synthase
VPSMGSTAASWPTPGLSDFLDSIPSEIVAEDLTRYRTDWWALALLADRSGNPLPEPVAAVLPRTTDEVSEVVRTASVKGVALVPRGGGSGVCGAALTDEGAVIVDLTAMNEVVELDETSLIFTAEAGITGPKLEEALLETNMFLGHVPQSFHFSTLGGWIGTKAIGQLSTRYGGIEDRLRGLTAILGDGTVVSSRAAPRSSTGPDWWRVFVGSEGVLGIVTTATLEAFRPPEEVAWLGFSPASFSAGLDLFRRMMQTGLRPSVARLYDEADSAINFARLGISGAVVILRFEGEHRLVEAEVAVARDIFSPECADLGDAAGKHWWDHRFNAVDAYRRLLAGEGALGPHAVVDTMEVATFWSGLDRLYENVAGALAVQCDGVLAHASHLYLSGANIYFTFLISSASDDEDAERRYRAAWDAGMRATLEAGGTISHHHGIGLLKQPWLAEELGSGFEALRRLKSGLDPTGRMNPGKLGLP